MKLALALLALSVFAGSDGTAPERKLADLFASAALAPLNRVADLPPDVVRTLEVSETFGMADPGEPWQPGCTPDASHPIRRLIVAGKSPSLVAVHYEQGGYATHRVLDLLRLSPDGKVEVRCMYTSSADPKQSLDELRRSFAADFQYYNCTRPDQNPS